MKDKLNKVPGIECNLEASPPAMDLLTDANRILVELINAGVSFQDERVDYVEMQIPKALLTAARYWIMDYRDKQTGNPRKLAGDSR